MEGKTLLRRCEYCGKLFETKILRKRFCCTKCRQKAGYITEALKKDEKIKRAVEKREKKEKQSSGIIYKDWDFKDKDCAEAWAFIKTIKQIDFKAFFEAEKERLRADMKKKKRARECLAEIE